MKKVNSETVRSLSVKLLQAVADGYGDYLVVHPGDGGDVFIEHAYTEEESGWCVMVLTDADETLLSKRERFLRDGLDLPTQEAWTALEREAAKWERLYNTTLERASDWAEKVTELGRRLASGVLIPKEYIRSWEVKVANDRPHVLPEGEIRLSAPTSFFSELREKTHTTEQKTIHPYVVHDQVVAFVPDTPESIEAFTKLMNNADKADLPVGVFKGFGEPTTIKGWATQGPPLVRTEGRACGKSIVFSTPPARPSPFFQGMLGRSFDQKEEGDWQRHLRTAVADLGWGYTGAKVLFRREDPGWRLGGGVVVDPWKGMFTYPTDPEVALRDIELMLNEVREADSLELIPVWPISHKVKNGELHPSARIMLEVLRDLAEDESLHLYSIDFTEDTSSPLEEAFLDWLDAGAPLPPE